MTIVGDLRGRGRCASLVRIYSPRRICRQQSVKQFIRGVCRYSIFVYCIRLRRVEDVGKVCISLVSRTIMSDHQRSSEDCPSCRMVGSATFATVGTYALWQSRAAAPGSPSQRRIVAGLGLGMLHSYYIHLSHSRSL